MNGSKRRSYGKEMRIDWVYCWCSNSWPNASESKFEKKVLPHADSELADQIRAVKPDKDNISANVGYQILQGKITNRQQLCDYLENFGEITRVNDKFISLKINGSQKAFRLKGPVYEYGADFKQLKNEFLTKGADYRKQLNDADFKKVRDTLKRLTDSRRQFNKKLISKPMVGRSNKNRLYGEKAIVKKLTSTNAPKKPQKVKEAPAQAQPMAQPQQASKPVVEPFSRADSSTKRNKDEPGDGWLRMPRHHGRSNRQVQVARCTSTSAEKNDTKSTVS